jgi:hypothetical protein
LIPIHEKVPKDSMFYKHFMSCAQSNTMAESNKEQLKIDCSNINAVGSFYKKWSTPQKFKMYKTTEDYELNRDEHGRNIYNTPNRRTSRLS